jgi:L-threonylcarbamoyladenylate synthase
MCRYSDTIYAMTEIILYPTETVYALGVNPLDKKAWQALCKFKQRSDKQPVSWLVRNIEDIKKYAEVGEVATRLVEKCMPGPITLVLPAKKTVPSWAQSSAGMVSFRISPDRKAQELIRRYMKEHNAPLTCTSANVHGLVPESDVAGILGQFGKAASLITTTIDGGKRVEMPSTVVAVQNEKLTILRVGPIPIEKLAAALG